MLASQARVVDTWRGERRGEKAAAAALDLGDFERARLPAPDLGDFDIGRYVNQRGRVMLNLK